MAPLRVVAQSSHRIAEPEEIKRRTGKVAPGEAHRPSSHRIAAGAAAADGGSGQSESSRKSRIGTSAAIKELCGKVAEKKKSAGSSSGSIVKTPKGAGEKRCETELLSDKEKHAPPKVSAGDEACHDQPYRHVPDKCLKVKEKWQNGLYCRDECGSGVIAKRLEFKHARQVWCSTPLSMYQATIGELGRQILCREKVVPRDVKPGPPCNVCEYILPPCRGYYRKYDCIRPCEEEYVSYKQGRKLYRDRVERYWEPCLAKDQRVSVDINTFAHQNVYLGSKLRRKFNESMPCW